MRDVIKAYYDKKNKKTQGQFTTENQDAPPKKAPVPVAAIAPRAALKPEDSAVHASNPVEQR